MVTAYHTYVPSFGEWGFCLVSNSMEKETIRKISGLRFYDYNFDQMAFFNKDMKAENLEVNRLDNQILVRYFDEEWGKVQ